MRREIIGCEESMSTAGGCVEALADAADAAPGGIDTGGRELLEIAPGVGLPSLCPVPENGLYFFGSGL